MQLENDRPEAMTIQSACILNKKHSTIHASPVNCSSSDFVVRTGQATGPEARATASNGCLDLGSSPKSGSSVSSKGWDGLGLEVGGGRVG